MSLLNKLISDSYQSLLKVVADTGLVPGVKQRVQDGKGTNTALEIATDKINVEGDLETGGTRRLTSSGVLTNVSGNVSQFTNDAGYLQTIPSDVIRVGDNVGDLTNDAGYLTDVPADVMREGENISLLNNDSGFITSGDTPQNLSDLNDDINNIVSGDPISSLNNDLGFVTGNTNNWDEGYNNSVSGLSVSGSNLVVERPSGNLSVSLPTTSGGGVITDTLDEVFRIPYDVNFNAESDTYTFFTNTLVFFPIKLKKGKAASAIVPIKTPGNNNIIVGLYDRRPPKDTDSSATYEYIYGVPNNLIVNFGSFLCDTNDTIYRLDLSNPVDIEDGVYFVGIGQNGQWISTGPRIDITSLKIKDNNYIDSDFIYQQDTYVSNKNNICRVASASTLPSTTPSVNISTSTGLLSYIKII